MTTEFIVTDKLQQRWDWSKYVLSRDIVLLLAIVAAYMYLPWETFTLLGKIYVVFLLIRYIISELTVLQTSPDKKKHFQISGHFGLFLLIVLFLQSPLQINNFISIGLLMSFGLLNIATKAHTTVDVVFTYLLVTWMYSMYLYVNPMIT